MTAEASQLRLDSDASTNSPRSGESKLTRVLETGHEIPANTTLLHHIKINFRPADYPLYLGDGSQLRPQNRPVSLCQ